MTRALLLLVLLAPGLARAQSPEPRYAPEAAAIGAVALGAATGLILGARDGAANDMRAAYQSHAPDALDYNHAWHRWGWASKGVLVVDLAGGVAIGGLIDPSPVEIALLAASFGAGVGLGFHFGHNWQQGQPWDYFGTVAASDGYAKAIGPRNVIAASVLVTSAVVAYTIWQLRKQ